MITNANAYKGRQLKQLSKTGLRQERLLELLCPFLIFPLGYGEMFCCYKKKRQMMTNGNLYSASVLKSSKEW